MFSFLLKALFSRRKNLPDRADRLRQAIGIDTSGPEFFDFYPTVEEIAEHIRATGRFHAQSIPWMAAIAHEHISGGGGSQKAAIDIIRSGDLLSPEEVKGLGYKRGTAKVGRHYAEALIDPADSDAANALQNAIHLASARASYLHSLRRMEQAEINTVTFSSPKDERNTPLEWEIEGKTMTIAEARRLVLERGDEIPRSVFLANFDP